MNKAYLSLGTNLGDKAANLNAAIRLIRQQVGSVTAVSSFHETKPWGFSSTNTFLNAAICVETSLTPNELLHATQAIEQALGRTHKSKNGQYADRIIDIDILTYDDLCIDTPELTIPHPLMTKRDFVMEPLREIL